MRGQGAKRRLLVLPHEAAVAEDIGAEYSGSLRSNTHLSTRLLLQPRLGHITIKAVPHRLLHHGVFPLHLQRKTGVDSHDFCRLGLSITRTAEFDIAGYQDDSGSYSVGVASQAPLQAWNCIPVSRHIGIGKTLERQVESAVERIQPYRLLRC